MPKTIRSKWLTRSAHDSWDTIKPYDYGLCNRALDSLFRVPEVAQFVRVVISTDCTTCTPYGYKLDRLGQYISIQYGRTGNVEYVASRWLEKFLRKYPRHQYVGIEYALDQETYDEVQSSLARIKSGRSGRKG